MLVLKNKCCVIHIFQEVVMRHPRSTLIFNQNPLINATKYQKYTNFIHQRFQVSEFLTPTMVEILNSMLIEMKKSREFHLNHY